MSGYCYYNHLYLGNILLHVTCLSTTNTNMAAPSLDICSVCGRKIPSHVKILKCDCRLYYVHRNRTSLYNDDLNNMINHSRSLSCIRCNENDFAFNHFIEDECFFPISARKCQPIYLLYCICILQYGNSQLVAMAAISDKKNSSTGIWGDFVPGS